MTPSTLPNGSITEAVTNPSLRGVIGWYSVAPRASSRCTVRLEVVDVPVHDHSTGLGGRAGRVEPPVDDAQLVLAASPIRNSM